MATKCTMWTRNPIHTHELTWTIENFSKMNHPILSPIFMPIPNCTEEWRLECTVKSISCKQNTEVPMYFKFFHLCSREVILSRLNEPTPCLVRTNIQLQENSGTIDKKFGPAALPFGKRLIVFSDQKTYGAETTNPLDIVFTEGKVILNACFSISGHQITSGIYPSTGTEPIPDHSEFLQHFKAMYRSNFASDLKISINGRELQVHKNIICSRSPVFCRMLQQDMLESKTNCISISDVDFHVFDCFLLFLYTGQVEDNNWDTVCGLYSVADKYEVPSLQQTCSRMMASTLKVDNVCEALLLADLHKDTALKDSVKHFMLPVFNQVISCAKWSDIIAQNPQLSSEVVGFMSAKLGNIAK